MRRFLALLLIGSFLANQAVSVPHTHSAGGTVAQSGHDAQPHFHLGGHEHAHTHGKSAHTHHGHSHGSKAVAGAKSQQSREFRSTSEHDSDACYLPTNVALSAARAAKFSAQDGLSLDAAATAVVVEISSVSTSVVDSFSNPHSLLDSSPPLYLRTSRIRC